MAAPVPSWREMAAQTLPDATEPAAPADYGLDAELVANLRRLRLMLPPAKIERAENWRAVVADALTIAREGWAATALALGWTASDLFGVGPVDSWDFEGLAVWLRGRRIVLLDDRRAVVEGDGGDYRSTFIRGGMQHGTHPTIEPVMLWEFGR